MELWNMPSRSPQDGLVQLPKVINYRGYLTETSLLSVEQLDSEGWNRAIPLDRESFTSYEVVWEKGADFIYREVEVSSVLDSKAYLESKANEVRNRRNELLSASDWTQVSDSPLSLEDVSLWKDYRTSLRNIPQQETFPLSVEWPIPPNLWSGI